MGSETIAGGSEAEPASTQTVASTKQAEIAAQQLHDLGVKLKQLVQRFKV